MFWDNEVGGLIKLLILLMEGKRPAMPDKT
jgi:hypothetical protein